MKLKDGFLLRQFGDKWLAVDAEGTANRLITLNKTAAFVWQELQNDIDRDTLIDRVCERFDGDKAAITADVDRFLQQARQAGILDE